MDGVKTLRDAIIYFGEFENCKKVMVRLRSPDGKVECPRCGSEKITWIANARVRKCYSQA